MRSHDSHERTQVRQRYIDFLSIHTSTRKKKQGESIHNAGIEVGCSPGCAGDIREHDIIPQLQVVAVYFVMDLRGCLALGVCSWYSMMATGHSRE